MNDLVLDLAELQTALDRVLAAAREQLGRTVSIPHDYYWHLWTDEAFDYLEDPARLTMGQLRDDLEELEQILSRPIEEDTIATWHDLLHLTGLLRAVEHLTGPDADQAGSSAG